MELIYMRPRVVYLSVSLLQASQRRENLPRILYLANCSALGQKDCSTDGWDLSRECYVQVARHVAGSYANNS